MPRISTPKRATMLVLLLVSFGTSIFGQPVIQSFTPRTAAQGAYVRISGKNFTGTTAVSFGGVAASSFSLEEDTAVIAVVGSGASGDVVVTTPSGSGTASGFVWKAQPDLPTINYFSPTSGKTGDTIFITGKNLTTAIGVAFGGIEAANFGVKNDSVLWAVLGTGETGFVNVTNPDGSSLLGGFTFIPTNGSLHLTRFSPDSVAAGGTVFISGVNLDSITNVSFGGVRARSFSMGAGDTLLTAVVGTGASGNILVSGKWGLDSLSGFRIIGSAADTGSTSPPPPVAGTFQLQDLFGLDSTESVYLFWNTLNDQRMRNYFVFAGQDSTNLGQLGTVVSLGRDMSSYTYNAVLGVGGMWYFQLHMEDSAGIITNSPILAVSHRGGTAPQVTGYPNPVTNMVTLSVPTTNATSYLLITDLAGRVVRAVVVAPNTLQVAVDVSGLNNGVYKVGWNDGKRKSVSTILVFK